MNKIQLWRGILATRINKCFDYASVSWLKKPKLKFKNIFSYFFYHLVLRRILTLFSIIISCIVVLGILSLSIHWNYLVAFNHKHFVRNYLKMVFWMTKFWAVFYFLFEVFTFIVLNLLFFDTFFWIKLYSSIFNEWPKFEVYWRFLLVYLRMDSYSFIKVYSFQVLIVISD